MRRQEKDRKTRDCFPPFRSHCLQATRWRRPHRVGQKKQKYKSALSAEEKAGNRKLGFCPRGRRATTKMLKRREEDGCWKQWSLFGQGEKSIAVWRKCAALLPANALSYSSECMNRWRLAGLALQEKSRHSKWEIRALFNIRRKQFVCMDSLLAMFLNGERDWKAVNKSLLLLLVSFWPKKIGHLPSILALNSSVAAAHIRLMVSPKNALWYLILEHTMRCRRRRRYNGRSPDWHPTSENKRSLCGLLAWPLQ